jgi:ADP-dependent NAD(P)H-hydrate dehydratase
MTTPILVRDVPRLPPRPRDGHKGTFGRVLVVAGSVGMSGAAVLAGSAALRGGAGIVQVAVPEPILPVVSGAQPCYLTAPLPADVQGRVSVDAVAVLQPLAEAASAVVVGPGLGTSTDVAAIVRALLENTTVPLLLDADALNSLAGTTHVLKQHKGPFVLTPHPGEFARLTGSTIAAVQADRHDVAASFARQHGGVLLLKGADTVVTDGSRLYVNHTGNPGMATGGAGDVLSGLLGALLASGTLPPFEATVLAAHLHGRAGDLARDRRGETALIASDLIEHLGDAFVENAVGGP